MNNSEYKLDKILFYLLVMAVVFSLSATIISLEKLGGIAITGRYANNQTNFSQGQIYLNVSQMCQLDTMNGTIDFGAGYVNGTCNNCTMDSDSTFDSICCVGFNSSANNETGILVYENRGNLPMIMHYNSSENASVFVNGTVPAPHFMIRTIDGPGDYNACGGSDQMNLSSSNYTEIIANSWQDVCVNESGTIDTGQFGLRPNQDNDSIRVHIKLVIPDDSLGGGNVTLQMRGTCPSDW